ncbi:MAG TPA: response regulator [Pirellulaceae bacterium]|nr:response regulator [Pirellulaceae bacterium]
MNPAHELWSPSVSSFAPVMLIIDSDPLLLTGMAAVLDMQGFECHLARDPEAAVKAARSLDLDLIICDVNLAGYSGLALCREMREEHGQAEVPVMFTSQQQLPDIIHSTFDETGAYYLRKPFEPSVLIELVNQALWMPHLVQTRVEPRAAAPVPKMVPAPLATREHAAKRTAQMPS